MEVLGLWVTRKEAHMHTSMRTPFRFIPTIRFALSGVAVFAAAISVLVSILAGDLRTARAATVQQCNQNHAVCMGQCAGLYNPNNPGPQGLCQAGCSQTQASCFANASDRSAAPPPGGSTKRTPDTAAPGVKPSLLERDTAPGGSSPAPTGRPAGSPGAGGVQLR